MDIFKNKVIKLAISGVALFAFGIFVGYQLNYGTISSIQGYLFNAAGEATDSNASNSNASNSNASNSNASDSNASDSNASSSNASDANASSANVSITDNIIFLQRFALGSTNAKQGDKVNVTVATIGACNSAISIVFKSGNGTTFTTQVQDITGNPYIVVPYSAVATAYSVSDVLLVGRNSDNTTFTKQYSTTGANTYNFNSTLTVEKATNSGDIQQLSGKVSLTSISLGSTSAKVSDKVYVNVQTSEKLNSLKLVFTSNTGKSFTVYAKDLSTKPYIEIPSSTVSGTYSLTSAIIATSKSSVSYSKDGINDTEKFDFNSTIEISSGTETTFIYNNEDVNSEVLTLLYNAPSETEITINADSNTLINEELFNAIKGKNKKLVINHKNNQIVFNGRDIDNSKTIDISMTVEDVTSNEKINKLVSNGIVVNFPDNGNLPGKALIRVKETDFVDSALNDTVYVYEYNESTSDFCVIDTNVKKSKDGYYEFAITHNSDFLIVNKKLDSKLVVSQSDDNIVNFQKGNGTLLMLIAVGVVAIIAVAIVIVVLKKKNNNLSKENQNTTANQNTVKTNDENNSNL